MSATGGTGRAGFVARHGLRDGESERLAGEVEKRIADDGIETVRVSFADQHGLLRGKTVNAVHAGSVLADGCAMTSTLLLKDTAHRTVYPVWSPGAGGAGAVLEGASDVIMVPDPATYRVLPWANSCAWMLCDLFMPDGAPLQFSTRRILAEAVDALERRGMTMACGLELEFHILKVEDPRLAPGDAGQPGRPPEVSLLAQGFQYLTETRADELEPVTDTIRRALVALDLPVRSIEVEFGPSQVEFTFDRMAPLAAADAMVLARSAIRQVCRRQGLIATFMCRPQIDNLFSCGWHVHQSLADKKTGENLFMPDNEGEVLSATGLAYVGGLLARAGEASVFAAPTINGYKRYQPHALAPTRANWGVDNKGAMVRVIAGAGDPGSRVENRAGEPAANPYLHIAAQIYAGLAGIDDKIDPGSPTHEPYGDEAPALPTSLIEAVANLRASAFFRARLGDAFVDYLATLKQAEIDRFLATVTDWEQREYFANF